MGLEKISYVSREDAEKGLNILRSGLPDESVPLQEGNGEFFGYYSLTRRLDGKNLKLIYEPLGEGKYGFRNAFHLE